MVVKCGCMWSATKFPITILRSICHTLYLTLPLCSVCITRQLKVILDFPQKNYLCFVESGWHWLLLPNLQSEVWFWIIGFRKATAKSQVSPFFFISLFSFISSSKSVIPFVLVFSISALGMTMIAIAMRMLMVMTV